MGSRTGSAGFVNSILVADISRLGRETQLDLPSRAIRRGGEAMFDVVPMILVRLGPGRIGAVEFLPLRTPAAKKAIQELGARIGRAVPSRCSLKLQLSPLAPELLGAKLSRQRRRIPCKASVRVSALVGGKELLSAPIPVSLHLRSARVFPKSLRSGIRILACISFFDCHSHWSVLGFLRPLFPGTRCCGPCTTLSCKCRDVADTWFFSPAYCWDWGWCVCR